MAIKSKYSNLMLIKGSNFMIGINLSLSFMIINKFPLENYTLHRDNIIKMSWLSLSKVP